MRVGSIYGGKVFRLVISEKLYPYCFEINGQTKKKIENKVKIGFGFYFRKQQECNFLEQKQNND